MSCEHCNVNKSVWISILSQEEIRELIADSFEVDLHKVKIDHTFRGEIYASVDCTPDPNPKCIEMLSIPVKPIEKTCPPDTLCPMDGFQTGCPNLWTEKCPYWNPSEHSV